MKNLQNLLLGSLLLSGLLLVWSGCETDGSVNGGVYYGSNYREPWFHDDNWMDGNRGYRERHDQPDRGGRVDVYINPPRPTVVVPRREAVPQRSSPPPARRPEEKEKDKH
jgi:hypothetical protein